MDFENRLVECAKLALDDFNQDVNAVQSQGITALMMAARQGHLKLAQLLIAKGARLDAMDTQRSALDVILGKLLGSRSDSAIKGIYATYPITGVSKPSQKNSRIFVSFNL